MRTEWEIKVEQGDPRGPKLSEVRLFGAKSKGTKRWLPPKEFPEGLIRTLGVNPFLRDLRPVIPELLADFQERTLQSDIAVFPPLLEDEGDYSKGSFFSIVFDRKPYVDEHERFIKKLREHKDLMPFPSGSTLILMEMQSYELNVNWKTDYQEFIYNWLLRQLEIAKKHAPQRIHQLTLALIVNTAVWAIWNFKVSPSLLSKRGEMIEAIISVVELQAEDGIDARTEKRTDTLLPLHGALLTLVVLVLTEDERERLKNRLDKIGWGPTVPESRVLVDHFYPSEALKE